VPSTSDSSIGDGDGWAEAGGVGVVVGVGAIAAVVAVLVGQAAGAAAVPASAGGAPAGGVLDTIGSLWDSLWGGGSAGAAAEAARPPPEPPIVSRILIGRRVPPPPPDPHAESLDEVWKRANAAEKSDIGEMILTGTMRDPSVLAPGYGPDEPRPQAPAAGGEGEPSSQGADSFIGDVLTRVGEIGGADAGVTEDASTPGTPEAAAPSGEGDLEDLKTDAGMVIGEVLSGFGGSAPAPQAPISVPGPGSEPLVIDPEAIAAQRDPGSAPPPPSESEPDMVEDFVSDMLDAAADPCTPAAVLGGEQADSSVGRAEAPPTPDDIVWADPGTPPDAEPELPPGAAVGLDILRGMMGDQSALAPDPSTPAPVADPTEFKFAEAADRLIDATNAPPRLDLPKGLHEAMSRAWDNSFSTGSAVENGGTLVSYPNGAIEVIHEGSGHDSAFRPEYERTRPDQTRIGAFHTHPYDGGHTGMTWSSGDFVSFINDGNRIEALQSGTEQYVMVRTDQTPAVPDYETIHQTYDRAYSDAYAANGGNHQEALKAAARATADGLNIKLYEGSGGDLRLINP
jgi:hypothetical protein